MKRVLISCALLFTPAMGFAKTCEVKVTGNDAMQYDTKEIAVEKTCDEVKVTLTHVGKLPKEAMGHNWTLSKTSDMQGVIADGLKAGLASDHIMKDDKRVVAHTKVVGGGQSDSVTFKLKALDKAADYSFFCTFPGHSGLMVGKFVVKK